MQTEVFVGIIVAYLLVYSYLFTPNTEFICVFLLIVMHLSTLIAMATDKNIDKSTTLSSIVDKRFLVFLDDATDVPLRVICMLALALQLVASIVSTHTPLLDRPRTSGWHKKIPLPTHGYLGSVRCCLGH